MDYRLTGAAAYNETVPVPGFAVHPETDVVGFEKYPELHGCFDASRVLREQQLQRLAASTSGAEKV